MMRRSQPAGCSLTHACTCTRMHTHTHTHTTLTHAHTRTLTCTLESHLQLLSLQREAGSIAWQRAQEALSPAPSARRPRALSNGLGACRPIRGPIWTPGFLGRVLETHLPDDTCCRLSTPGRPGRRGQERCGSSMSPARPGPRSPAQDAAGAHVQPQALPSPDTGGARTLLRSPCPLHLRGPLPAAPTPTRPA